ncbi:MAG: hypothetical protein K9N51_10980 [Candidatus Pacebacteria bacterium]|nr:hypothetical protein [Candidatus Paceibacterota bacterium]
MSPDHFHAINTTVKWVTLVFAWMCWAVGLYFWISGSYVKLLLAFALGLVPYLIVYNWLIRGVLQSRVAPESES